jgi:hypothetical protein
LYMKQPSKSNSRCVFANQGLNFVSEKKGCGIIETY